MCCREAEEKEKRKRAGNDPIVSRALAIFQLLLFFIGVPSGSFRGGDRKFFFFNLSKTLVSEYCSYFLSLPLPESVNEGISPKVFLTFVEKILFLSTMEQFFSQHLFKIKLENSIL